MFKQLNRHNVPHVVLLFFMVLNKLTTEIFIKRSIEIHKNKYDYSKSNYINSGTKLEIICPIHGGFLQVPYVHLRGGGCSKCGKAKLSLLFRKSNNDFIKQCSAIHNNRYLYDKTLYIKNFKRINVKCRIHGDFTIIPHRHLQGYGCPKCVVSSVLLNTEKFINKAIVVHKDRYDYSKVIYKKNNIHIDIICKEHGTYSIPPVNHLGGRRCPKCGIFIRSNKLRMSTDKFVSKSVEIHFNRYMYSKVKYINTYTKVIINCYIHGDFGQTPAAHLKGQGCPKCGISLNALNQTKNTDWFITNANKIHNNKYDYSNSVYISARDKIDIICNRHGVFKIQPTSHINLKQGCPKCYMSKGENAIYLFFNKINLPIETQKKFKNCKRSRMLPFDFYVPKFNTLIEYDGEFHYMPIYKLGGEKSFKITQETDRIKNEFVKENNIKLIRIPYWEFDNIENILKKELCI